MVTFLYIDFWAFSYTSMFSFSIILEEEFILGLITGQCLLFLIFYIFVRYFLLTTKLSSPILKSRKSEHFHEKLDDTRELFSSFITDDDFYLLKKHQSYPSAHDAQIITDDISSQDTAWINMLLRIIHHLPFTSSFTYKLLENISSLINSKAVEMHMLEWIESISLKEWQWGMQSPTVSDIQYRYDPNNGVTIFRLHLDWNRPCSFTLTSSISIHSTEKIWIPLQAHLPVSLSVHVERLSGYLFCSHKGSKIGLTLHPTFHISFRFDSELGNVSKLRNLPRISDWIHAHSILGIQQALYLPNYHVFSINEM